MEARRRWGVFLVALAGSAVLAVGFGVGIGRAVQSPRAAPHLRTVPAGALARAGITMGPADQPPYCGAGRPAAGRGWVPSGLPGCAISGEEARASLLPAFQGMVTEAVLARVSGPAGSGIGQGRLVWLVVVRSSLLVLPATACAPPVASGPACAVRDLGPVSPEAIVFVDGSSGQVLTTLPVAGRASAGPVGGAGPAHEGGGGRQRRAGPPAPGEVSSPSARSASSK